MSGFGDPQRYAIEKGDGSVTTVTIMASDKGFQSQECGVWTRK